MAGLQMQADNDTSLANHNCPVVYNCSDQPHQFSFDIGKTPSYVAIVSSSLSCLGSVLIFVAFLALKDLRTSAQKIITFLAFADFISAAGYILGSGNFLVHFNETNGQRECPEFSVICLVQASITAWSSLCSFAWTLILGFYFYLVIVYNRKPLAVRLMPLYHILAWVVPTVIIVPLAVTKKLGYAPFAASNWCYVKDTSNDHHQDTSDNDHLLSVEGIGMILLAGKFWEISTYCCVIVVYAHIVCHISKIRRRRRKYLPTQAISIMEQAEKRLIYIPVFFIILRIWGTVQFLISIPMSKNITPPGCITQTYRDVFFAFGILQAIGDPGQGWGNAILYVFLSPVVRERLFLQFCDCSCVEKLQTALDISVGPHSSTRRKESPRRSSKEEEEGAADDRGKLEAARRREDENTILSLNERPYRVRYGSTDHKGGPSVSS